MNKLLPGFEGALYKDDVVLIREWTEVSSKDDSSIVIFVEDSIGKHHTVSLNDIDAL